MGQSQSINGRNRASALLPVPGRWPCHSQKARKLFVTTFYLPVWMCGLRKPAVDSLPLMCDLK